MNNPDLAELNIRDFIILHYKLTDRADSAFWRYCRNMAVPASLTHRMDMFASAGKVYKFAQELFGESSWIQVMMGQGLLPEQYHPIVDLMSDEELAGFLDGIRQQVKKRVENFPAHTDFIAHYCPSAIV